MNSPKFVILEMELLLTDRQIAELEWKENFVKIYSFFFPVEK